MWVIHDLPFDFSDHRIYPMNITVEPGDSLTTTCTYSTPATFGGGTEDEMCSFFTIHWPYGALSSFGLGPLVHGANACLP